MVGVELIKNIAAEVKAFLVQKAFGEFDKLPPGNKTVLVAIEDVEQLGNHLFSFHVRHWIESTRTLLILGSIMPADPP